MRTRNRFAALFLIPILLFAVADLAHSYCLIRGGLGGPGNREDCCSQDISQWRAENLPVPMWINQDTDPALWDGIRESYAIWGAVTSSYFAAIDSGFTPLNNTNPYDGINLVSFSNDSSQFPVGSNTIAFTSGNWGTNISGDETITGFDVIFNDVGFDFGDPPGPGDFSVIGITNHELGHAWAIAHCWEGGPPGCGPNCTTSTMYGYASPPALSDESLELDDIAAVSLAYPKWLLQGVVRDAVSSDPIPLATVTPTVAVAKDTIIYGVLPDSMPGNGSACGFVGGAISANEFGFYELVALEPSFEVVVFRSGYFPDTVQVAFTGIDTLVVDVSLDRTAFSSINGTLTDEDSGEGIAAAIVLMQNDAPYDTAVTNPATGEYSFPSVPVSMPPFVEYTGFEILGEIPYPQSSMIDMAIQVSEGGPTEVNLTLLPANVFLVDDDEGEDYEQYFTGAITGAGRTFHHFDIDAEGESAVNYVDLFPLTSTVVWFTGDATTNTLSETEQDSLADFLDRGGKLFLTGQNIAEDLHGAGSAFLSDYLHVTQDGNVSYFMGRGVQGNPVTGFLQFFLTVGTGGANNQTSRDLLVPTDPATEFIHYISSPSDLTPRGTAAVYVEGGNASKAILMGFGFEAVNQTGGDSTRASRAESMLAILNWFDGITGIGDDDQPVADALLPKVFSLGQNYPNPFNPQTTIRFSIPAEPGREEEQNQVVLNVYNLRGQRIAKLLDREMAPGNYTVQWDGKDSRGNVAPSGIYLYKLTWGDKTSTRKMVVLK